jgi:hypothetical protein
MSYTELWHAFRNILEKMEDSADNIHVFTRNEEIVNATKDVFGLVECTLGFLSRCCLQESQSSVSNLKTNICEVSSH